jgi:hypothetical protein
MASTYSTNLKIELITTGEQTGDWGITTNDNFSNVFEQAIVGRGTATFASDANLTLTLTNSVASQTARNVYLNVTSGVSLTATRDLIVPTIYKNYIVENNTTGGQSIIIKTVAGTGITIPNGKRVPVYVDSTNVVVAFDYLAGNVQVGGALTTAGLTSSADGTFSGTGQVKMPAGTTAQRSGSPANGMLRYNSDSAQFEGYAGGQWGGIGGAQAGGAIQVNKTTAASDYTIAEGENGFSVGPITIASGVTITVASGQRWLVL